MNSPDQQIRVWDPLIRLFHWGLAGAFTFAYLTAEEMESVHALAGYLVAGLIAVRLIWGVVGPRHARFSRDFLRPTAVVGYLRDLVGGRARRYLGHSPAGGAMTIALLVAIAVTAGTGIVMGPDGEGEEGLVYGLHELAASATLALIFVHLAGVVLASFVHRENLPLAMVTGYKRPLTED